MSTVPNRPPSQARRPDYNALSCKNAAVAYLAAGAWPVPIEPGKKKPIGVEWGVRRHTPDSLAKIYRDFPEAGVGMVLGPGKGPDGSWLADAEVDGPRGEESLYNLFRGEDVRTYGHDSGRGPHRFLIIDDPDQMLELLAALNGGDSGVLKMEEYPDLELRIGREGRQLQTVVAPTPGRTWNGVLDFAPFPRAGYASLRAVVAARQAARRKAEADPRKRNGTTASAGSPEAKWYRAALAGEADKVAAAVETTRHDTLLAAARTLGGYLHLGHFGDSDATAALTQAARQAGLPDDEIAETIADGLAYGKAKPLPPHDKLKQGRQERATGKPGAEINYDNVMVDSGGEPTSDGPTVIPIPTAAKVDGSEVNEAGDDPHRLARIYRDANCLHADGLTLRYWQGEFRRWYDGAYHPVANEELRPSVGSVVKDEFNRLNVEAIETWERSGKVDEKGKACPKPSAKKVTEQLKNNVIGNLASLTLTERSKIDAQPAWLDVEGPWPAREVVPTRNRLVHLASLVENRPDYAIPATPRFFSDFALGYDFDPDAPAPISWLTFLGAIPPQPGGRVQQQLWPDDPEAIDLLQEWFGYLLTPDTKQQKILALIGPKRGGKDTIARILTALIGSANVAGPTLSSLATNFGLAPLIGKHAAIVSDARLSGKTDSAIIVERLLTISGEGFLTVDRKHMPSWNGKLPTRFVIISNELPRLADSSGALASRLLIQRLTRSFYGKEDEGLTDHLLTELPGILLWAIEGWRRLRERGHFLQPETGRELVEELENLSSPIGAFVREACERPESGQAVAVRDIFAAWAGWCREKRRNTPGDETDFGRKLRSVIAHLKVTQPRDPETGKQIRHYEGVALNEYGKQLFSESRDYESRDRSRFDTR